MKKIQEATSKFGEAMKLVSAAAAKAAEDAKPTKSVTGSRSFVLGRPSTVGDLESNLWRVWGIRVVFRVPASTRLANPLVRLKELGDAIDDSINGVRNAAQLRNAILKAILLAKGRAWETRLTKDEVAILSPQGILVNGNTLVKNIRFKD